MDIPRRKNLDRPDKLTAELLFFCFWLTHCGEVELGDFNGTAENAPPPAIAAMRKNWRRAAPYRD